LFLTGFHLHNATERTITTAFQVAQVRNIQSSTDAQGGLLRQAVRHMMIGGMKITFERHIAQMGNPDNTFPGAGSNLDQVDSKWLICSDRTVFDFVSGNNTPSSLAECNFFSNTQPAATVNEVQDYDEAFPTRIHWQDYKCLVQGLNNFAQGAAEPADDIGYGQKASGVYSTHSGTNLRLRLRLQEDEGLYVVFTSHLRSIVDADQIQPQVSFVATGTVWYRYVF